MVINNVNQHMLIEVSQIRATGYFANNLSILETIQNFQNFFNF